MEKEKYISINTRKKGERRESYKVVAMSGRADGFLVED